MKGMSQSLNFGKSVGDNGWGMFLKMLEYKLMFLGKQFLKIDKYRRKLAVNVEMLKRNWNYQKEVINVSAAGLKLIEITMRH